jgi:8-oxo-dGTP pyrophosphatase MutT (NUDIX family)
MPPQHIRVISICVIRRNDDILVFEGYDHVKDQTFFRPLGGGVEFGESSLEALNREFREEINARLKNVRYLQTLENIFEVYGKPGHEVIFIYSGDLIDATLYEKEVMVGFEDNGDRFKALWMPLDTFRSGRYPLYPTGLLELIDAEK